ncbi:MAG: response regulator transcription factor [Planctomycetaceae bacterium]
MDSPTKILLIEDDREIASTIQNVLQANGFAVTWANNGLEGQRQAEAIAPDLVITDMMMPKMGGFPILEFLKSLPRPPHVIMITANEGGRHKAYAEMLGVDDYIRKPFAMEVLIEAIERILRGEKKSPDATTGSSRLRRSATRKRPQ